MELQHLGWNSLEEHVFTFAHCLLVLDLSFNQIETLPDEIAALSLLKELNVACNKLKSFPNTISSLQYLQQIKANGNQVRFGIYSVL